MNEDMPLNAALNIALSTMYQALDEIDEMPEEDRKYLKIKPEALRAAMRTIDIYLRETTNS